MTDQELTDQERREEAEWEYALSRVGLGGFVNAVVKLLMKKRMFTVDELKEQLQAEAGVR